MSHPLDDLLPKDDSTTHLPASNAGFLLNIIFGGVECVQLEPSECSRDRITGPFGGLFIRFYFRILYIYKKLGGRVSPTPIRDFPFIVN